MAEHKRAGDKPKSIPRRDFLIGSSAAAAAGALVEYAPHSVAAPLSQTARSPAKSDHAASTGYLVYDSRL